MKLSECNLNAHVTSMPGSQSGTPLKKKKNQSVADHLYYISFRVFYHLDSNRPTHRGDIKRVGSRKERRIPVPSSLVLLPYKGGFISKLRFQRRVTSRPFSFLIYSTQNLHWYARSVVNRSTRPTKPLWVGLSGSFQLLGRSCLQSDAGLIIRLLIVQHDREVYARNFSFVPN